MTARVAVQSFACMHGKAPSAPDCQWMEVAE